MRSTSARYSVDVRRGGRIGLQPKRRPFRDDGPRFDPSRAPSPDGPCLCHKMRAPDGCCRGNKVARRAAVSDKSELITRRKRGSNDEPARPVSVRASGTAANDPIKTKSDPGTLAAIRIAPRKAVLNPPSISPNELHIPQSPDSTAPSFKSMSLNRVVLVVWHRLAADRRCGRGPQYETEKGRQEYPPSDLVHNPISIGPDSESCYVCCCFVGRRGKANGNGDVQGQSLLRHCSDFCESASGHPVICPYASECSFLRLTGVYEPFRSAKSVFELKGIGKATASFGPRARWRVIGGFRGSASSVENIRDLSLSLEHVGAPRRRNDRMTKAPADPSGDARLPHLTDQTSSGKNWQLIDSVASLKRVGTGI